MLKKILNVALSVVILMVVTGGPQLSYAQEAVVTEQKSELKGTRKQLATIIFSGLAGAILGLSTLSFYGRPQDHLSNIAVGFAVGIISGTVYTTYQAATKPYETYETQFEYEEKIFNTNQLTQLSQNYKVSYSWSF